MARSYSQDLRDRVIEATESGTSARKAAARFEVAASTAIKWLERLRDSGERSARRQGRRPGSKLDPHRDFLLAAVEAEPDSTLGELQRRLVEERGVRAGIGTIWTFLDRYDLTFKKKSAYAAEQNRPDVREEREDWFEGQLDLEPERLVFVDESFATTSPKQGDKTACAIHAEEVSHVQFGKGRIACDLARQDVPVGVDHLARHQRREIRMAAQAQDGLTLP